jgi:hypothetical protein
VPTVSAPPAPTGTRSVAINYSGQNPGDFATLKNLTLNSNVGSVAVPPGTYGNFSANSGSGFTFGTAGAIAAAVYNIQSLTLNSGARLQIVDLVVLTLANGMTLNTMAGTSANPGWLTLKIASGGLTLNSGSFFYGRVVAPNGTVLIGGQLTGALTADRLTVNSGGLLKVLASVPPPTVSLTAPAGHTVEAAPASVTLAAAASSSGDTIAKVDFYFGARLLGTATDAPYQFTWTNVPAGTYALTARATDNSGATTTSSAVTVVVDAPPEVILTAPAAGSSFFTPGTIDLVATATSPAQTIAKVEFYSGETLLAAATASPYQFSWVNPAAGNHTLSAKATDSLGISATSAAATITIVADEPPVITVSSTGCVFPTTTPVTLSFTATDAVTAVSKIEIYRASGSGGNASGDLIGTLTAPASGSTWIFNEPANLVPGTYSYVARAYDTNGSFTDSAPVVITVLPVLPYTSDFEAGEGYATGSLQAQQGWLVEQGSAVVTALDAAHGNQSVQLPAGSPPSIVSQDFAPGPGGSVEFFDFFAKPVAQAGPTPTVAYHVESAQFGFVQSGENAALQIFRGDHAGGGTWAVTPFTVSLASSVWLRLTARLDFAQKTWDLYANARMVAADVPFSNDASTALTLFQAPGDGTTASGLDDIYAGPINPSLPMRTTTASTMHGKRPTDCRSARTTGASRLRTTVSPSCGPTWPGRHRSQ